MNQIREFTIRTDEELRLTAALTEQVEALLRHFEDDLFPLCDMHAHTVRSLHRKLQDLDDDLLNGIDRYTRH